MGFRRHGPFQVGDQVQLTDPKNKRHTITLKQDGVYHTHKGAIPHSDLIGQPEGSVVRSSGGTAYLAFRHLLQDYTLAMPRGAAVIYPKDASITRAPGKTSAMPTIIEASLG
jgi:tRNA (adenine57-N1/adenine58-N1)-methyltransferase